MAGFRPFAAEYFIISKYRLRIIREGVELPVGFKIYSRAGGFRKNMDLLEEIRQELKDPLGDPFTVGSGASHLQMEYALLGDSELEGSARAGVGASNACPGKY